MLSIITVVRNYNGFGSLVSLISSSKSKNMRGDFTKYLGAFLCIEIQEILLTSSESRKPVIKDNIPFWSNRVDTRIENQRNIR